MIAYFSNWLIFFPVAFSLFVALRLSQASVDQGRDSSAMIAIRGLITLMFVLSLLAIGLRPSPISLVWFMLLGFCAFAMFLKSRRLARSALFLAARNETDLTAQHALVGFFYNENTGWLRRKAKQLGRDLASGVPWERALENRGIARSVYERLALRLQSLHGMQEKSERREESTEMLAPLQIEAEAERLLGRLMIFSWVIFLPALVALILVFILPTIQEMFREFGMRLPASTQVLADASSLVSQSGFGFLVAAASLTLALTACLLVLLWLAPSLLQLSGLRWICQDYYQNAGYTVLASLLNQDLDILTACRETVRIMPVPHIAHRFHAAASLMEQGASPTTAFQKTRLLSPRELSAFGPGLEANDPAWVLRELAGWKTERMLYRYSIIVQVLVVLVTLLFAVVIGLLAVGIIAALSTLITSLT